MINFYLQWAIDYCLVMFAMCTDNLFWISTSPEYESFKLVPWFGKQTELISGSEFTQAVLIEGKVYENKFSYILRYRILSVLKSWRDIVPAIITSFLMTWILTALLLLKPC